MTFNCLTIDSGYDVLESNSDGGRLIARRDVSDGNRGLSWFSKNDPSRVVSVHKVFKVLTPFARLSMLPFVDERVSIIQYQLRPLALSTIVQGQG